MTKQSETEWLLQQHAWITQPDGMLLWAVAMQLRNEKGAPMEWGDHRFMLEPLCDLHPWQVIVKCAQVGLTTINVFRTIFMAQVLGYGVIYTLPTKELVSDFSSTKVEPILVKNPVLAPTGADAVGKRTYGGGFVLYRGTFGEREAIMVTSDLNVYDEADRSNLGVLHGLESRLQASLYKGQWWFSNPTRPNVGTDLFWQMSDQRKWHVTCRSCGDEQPLDGKAFWTNIDREREAFVCRRCRGELTDDDRRDGRWIATNPSARKWHGYTMSHLMAPWISAADILEAERTKPKEYFFNFVLGLPVVGEGISVDPALILQSQVWPVPVDLVPRQRFLGVDVGGGLHCIVGTEHGVTKLAYLTDDVGYNPKVQDGKQSKWDKLNLLMAGTTLCVIDNGPAEKQPEFQARHGRHRVLRCIYDYNDKRKENWEQNRDEGTLHAHRTRVIDDVIDAFSHGELPVYLEQTDPWLNGTGKPGTIENALAPHWGTLYVVGADGQDVNLVKKDRMGNVIRTWEAAGPDHFAHATVYCWLARQAGRHLGGDAAGFVAGAGPRTPRKRSSLDDWDDDPGSRRPGFWGR